MFWSATRLNWYRLCAMRTPVLVIGHWRRRDCRNRGTRFLLRDFARGLSRRRGKHPEQQGKQEKHKPRRGKLVHACSYASSHQHRIREAYSARGSSNSRSTQEEIWSVFDHPPTQQTENNKAESVSPLGNGAAGEFVQWISGKQLNGRRRPQLALPVQAGSCALHSLQGASLPSPPCLKDCP